MDALAQRLRIAVPLVRVVWWLAALIVILALTVAFVLGRLSPPLLQIYFVTALLGLFSWLLPLFRWVLSITPWWARVFPTVAFLCFMPYLLYSILVANTRLGADMRADTPLGKPVEDAVFILAGVAFASLIPSLLLGLMAFRLGRLRGA